MDSKTGLPTKRYKMPEYDAFIHARVRCINERDGSYHNYGGRGIQFRFKSFEEFYEHIGPRPEGTSLDRIDNDGHYELGNVRWATAIEQAASKRATRLNPIAVRVMRHMYSKGISVRRIADAHNMKPRYVRQVIECERWKHVE